MRWASSTGDCAEPRDCNRTPEEAVKYNKRGKKVGAGSRWEGEEEEERDHPHLDLA